MRTSLLFCLLLASCGSGSDYPQTVHKEIEFYAVNVDCQFANQVVQGTLQLFKDAGIHTVAVLHCIRWDKSYEFGETKKALAELSAKFGKGHYFVPRFGSYFDGVSNSSGSISVAVEGRLLDSVEQAAHEIGHSFGASHDYADCNLMGYRRCGYPAKFNEKAIKEMR